MYDANCASCGRTWQVKLAGRTYKCKACGGKVLAEEPGQQADDLDDMLTCPSCSALNAPGSAFCGECGTELEGSAEGGTGQSPAQRLDRLKAGRQMAKSKKDLRGVRLLFGLGALLYGGITVLLVLAVPEAPEAEARGVLIASAALLGVLAVLHGVGAWRVFKEPLLWSLLLASLSTLDLAVLFYDSGFAFSAGLVFKAVWTLALWVVVKQVAKVRALIQEYPDLWLALQHHHRRSAYRDQLGSEETARERARRHARAGGTPLWRLVVGAVGAVAVVWGIWWFATREPPLRPVVTRFSEDWNASRLDAVTEQFASERMAGSFTRVVDRRGWSAELPALGQPDLELVGEGRALVIFACDGGQLLTSWQVKADGWKVTTVRFPGDEQR